MSLYHGEGGADGDTPEYGAPSMSTLLLLREMLRTSAVSQGVMKRAAWSLHKYSPTSSSAMITCRTLLPLMHQRRRLERATTNAAL